MQRLKVSFVTTVLNEERSIRTFLNSIFSQTKIIDEIIIVDGGSTDKTIEIIKKNIQEKNNCKFFIQKGNRSVGRNYGIEKAKNNIILISDAGCSLDKSWAENISKHFSKKGVDVVAGYYKGKYNNIFQKCLIPYVLVMPDKVNEKTFLPATRSMAIRKKIWEKIGKFPEEHSHNEDFVFANKLKHNNVKIFFEKKAIVHWISRRNLQETFIMFFRFAFGDGQAKILRLKVALIYARYIIGITIIIYLMSGSYYLATQLLFIFFVIYSFWSIIKNFHYVKNWKAIYMLPILQITSDFAILAGTLTGFISAMKKE